MSSTLVSSEKPKVSPAVHHFGRKARMSTRAKGGSRTYREGWGICVSCRHGRMELAQEMMVTFEVAPFRPSSERVGMTHLSLTD